MTGSTETADERRFSEERTRFYFVRLRTEVREDGVYVRLAPIQRSFSRIRPAALQAVEVTGYDSSRYGGWHWGIRWTPGGNRVYRLYSGDGVEVTKTDGERWFIGTARPAALRDAIDALRETT